MPRAPPPGFLALTAVLLFVWYVFWTRNHERPVDHLSRIGGVAHVSPIVPEAVTTDVLHGKAIMGKLGNETAKAELGRAAWKLFHTTMGRFPDEPTTDESKALKDYIYLFARLYPCGECAEHFQKLLAQYPPQTSSRSSAAAWACFVHNQVNVSKGKPEFDCANIGDWYNCGCADDEKKVVSKIGSKMGPKTDKAAKEHEKIEIETEGLTKGG